MAVAYFYLRSPAPADQEFRTRGWKLQCAREDVNLEYVLRE